MSLVSTLAKVAVGVVIAKGVTTMMQGAQAGPATGGSSGGGTGGLFGGANSPSRSGTGAQTGLEDIMKSVLGGSNSKSSGGARTSTDASAGGDLGGLGGLLEQLAGGASGKTAGSGKGGLDDLLGSLTGGQGGKGGLDDLLGSLTGGQGGKGGLGDLLGGLVGGMAGGAGSAGAAAGTRSFGELLNESIQNFGEPEVPPTPNQEAAAALMLRAMIQAAKSDGKIDEAEKKKLLDNLKDGTAEDLAFVQAELAAPVNVEKLVREVPKGLEAQIYTVSVMAINLDNKAEAQYLHALASGFGIDPAGVNGIHAKLGVPALYS